MTTKEVVRWADVAPYGADPDGLTEYTGDRPRYTDDRPRCAAAIPNPGWMQAYRVRQCSMAVLPGHEFCAFHGGPLKDPKRTEAKRRRRERQKREREVASLVHSYRRSPDPLSVILLAGFIEWDG